MLEIRDNKQSKFKIISLFFAFIFFVMINRVGSALTLIDDPSFRVGIIGYFSLFSNQLRSYPFTTTTSITFSSALPPAIQSYDLVLGINTFSFIETNWISYNLTKSNLNLVGFQMTYNTGYNSLIYELGINYMVVQHAYNDFQISYFDFTCAILNQGSGDRSQNVTYTISKFPNDQLIYQAIVLEAFNLTDTNNDYITLQHQYYTDNLNFTVKFITTGLTQIIGLKFYFIFCNMAESSNNYLRYYMVNQYLGLVSPSGTLSSPVIQVDYLYPSCLFSGVSGFNMSKQGSKRFQFTFHTSSLSDYTTLSTPSSTGKILSIDYTVIGLYNQQCDPLEVYDPSVPGCVGSCNVGDFTDTTGNLAVCRHCHKSCNTCSGFLQTQCLGCQIHRDQLYDFTGVTSTCPCTAGYFNDNLDDCVPCINFLASCSQCSSNSTCTLCSSSSFILVNGICRCSDISKFYDYGSATCMLRIIGCKTHIQDGLTTICNQCYYERGFRVDTSFNCNCYDSVFMNVVDITGLGDYWCNFTCGDGHISVDQMCDDANIISGDGCSSYCKVEDYYECTNTSTTASVCLYTVNTSLAFFASDRVFYTNIAVLNFTISPYYPYINQITNLSSIVQTNLSYSKIQNDLNCSIDQMGNQTCFLTFTVTYNKDIQNQPFYIYLGLASTSPGGSPKVKYDSRTCYFTPKGNIAKLTFETNDTLSQLQNLQLIILLLVVIAIVVSITSIFFQKMIGLQLISSLQFMYYLLSSIQSSPIHLLPLQTSLKKSNGFNQLYNYTYYRYAPLPNQLNHQFYQKQFLLNMNVMYCGLIGILVGLVGFKLYIKYQQSNSQKQTNLLFEDQNALGPTFFKYYNFYWNNVYFFYVFFVLNQTLFNTTISTIEQSPSQRIFSLGSNFVAALSAFIIVILTVLSLGQWYRQQRKIIGGIRLDENPLIPYKFFLCKNQYLLAYSCVKVLKIWTICLFFKQIYCLYVTVSISSIYLIFLLIYRPYQKRQTNQSFHEDDQEDKFLCISIHNFGVAFNQLTIIAFTTMCIVWNISASNNQFQTMYQPALLYLPIFMIFLLIIVAGLRIFYKRLGKLICCKIQNVKGLYDSQDAFAKMRNVIRDEDLLKPKDQLQFDFQKADDKQAILKKQKLKKMLNQIKKSKTVFNNWKNDQPQFPQYQRTDTINENVKQRGQNTLKKILNQKQKSQINQNSQNAIFKGNSKQKAELLQKFVTDFTKIKFVQMQRTKETQNYAKVSIGRSVQKKAARLTKPFIESILQNKHLQNLSLIKSRQSNVLNQINEKQQLEKNVRQRLNRQFQEKKQKKQTIKKKNNTPFSSFLPN